MFWIWFDIYTQCGKNKIYPYDRYRKLKTSRTAN